MTSLLPLSMLRPGEHLKSLVSTFVSKPSGPSPLRDVVFCPHKRLLFLSAFVKQWALQHPFPTGLKYFPKTQGNGSSL